MKAFVLNLDSRPERWDAIKSRFRGSNITLERIPAIPHEIGMYGNFLSFLKAFRLAKRRGLESVLILEDDCVPTKNWETNWKQIKGWLDSNPDEWDIYSGGAWGGNSFVQKITDWLGMKPNTIGKVGNNTIFKYPVVTMGAHWLYIPKRTLDKVIDRYSSISFLPKVNKKLGMDMLHGFFFKIVSSYPFIAYQASAYSNIDNEDVEKKEFIQSSEKQVGRQLRKTRKNRNT
jgi:hypothetical protein